METGRHDNIDIKIDQTSFSVSDGSLVFLQIAWDAVVKIDGYKITDGPRCGSDDSSGQADEREVDGYACFDIHMRDGRQESDQGFADLEQACKVKLPGFDAVWRDRVRIP